MSRAVMTLMTLTLLLFGGLAGWGVVQGRDDGLGIVSVLSARPEEGFSGLKALLGRTQGNLGLHLRKLEEAGYVRVEKAFVRRKPRTTVRLSAAGRTAFMQHVEQLQRIAEGKGLPE